MKTPLMALGTKYDAVPVDACNIEIKSLNLKDNPIPEAEKSRIIAALPKCKVNF